MRLPGGAPSSIALAVAAVVAPGACTSRATEEVHDGEDDPRFAPAAEREAAERRGRIEAELAALGTGHPWAGSYYEGDGLGENVSVWLAPEAGFVFEWHGCLGLYDRNYGSVRERDGVVELVFELPNAREPFGLAERLVPVAWGPRRYLIEGDDFTTFANWTNAGFEPRDGVWGPFLLRRGDEGIAVGGKPAVPQEHAALFLDAPIEAHVATVDGSRTERRGDVDYRVTTVTLDVGAEDGAFAGMELYPVGIARAESFTLKVLGPTSSTAECVDYAADGPLPERGWVLVTRR